MNRKLLFGCLWLLITPLLLISPAVAAGTRVTAELGYGGYTVPGRWMPLRIKLDQPINQGWIEVARRNQTGNATIIETFPANFPRIECPILNNEELKGITVRIKSGMQTLGESKLNLGGRQFSGHLFLTVNVPATMQHAIEGMLQPQEPVLAVPVNMTELPFSPLGYDSISGVVMADPGPVLKPAQVSAFKAWVSSGGCAVIYGSPPNSESIVQLLKIQLREQMSVIKRVPLGFGKLILISDNFRDDRIGASPPGWQKMIELPPYRNSTRLSLNRCFPQQGFKPRPFDLRIDLMVILGLWMTALLVVLFLQKQNLFKITLCSVLMIALAIPLSNHLAEKWHGGYDMRCLAVNLPESSGTVIKAEMAAGENSRWNLKAAPWGVEIDFGNIETGFLKPNGKFPEWHHLEPQGFSTLQHNTSETYYFIGWLPEGIFTPKFIREPASRQEILVYRSTGKIYRIPEGQYQRWMGFINGRLRTALSPEKDLVPISQFPLWLNGKDAWLKRLSTTASPETLWIIEHRTTSGGFLQIRKSIRMELIWVSPLPNASLLVRRLNK